MGKEELYLNQAEDLYVQDHCGTSEIARRLPVCEKTLRNWKHRYGWDTKRSEFIRSRKTLDSDLYDFVRELMDSIKRDWKDGKQVDPGRLYAVGKLLPSLKRAREYEDFLVSINATSKKTGESTYSEAIRAVRKQLGIEPDDEDNEMSQPQPESKSA